MARIMYSSAAVLRDGENLLVSFVAGFELAVFSVKHKFFLRS
jgi:hypothetical protein